MVVAASRGNAFLLSLWKAFDADGGGAAASPPALRGDSVLSESAGKEARSPWDGSAVVINVPRQLTKLPKGATVVLCGSSNDDLSEYQTVPAPGPSQAHRPAPHRTPGAPSPAPGPAPPVQRHSPPLTPPPPHSSPPPAHSPQGLPQLEALVRSAEPGAALLYYTADNAPSSRLGDTHVMVSLYRNQLLPRLLAAAAPSGGSPRRTPELALHASWREQLAPARVAAEEFLGLSPRQLARSRPPPLLPARPPAVRRLTSRPAAAPAGPQVGHEKARRWASDGRQERFLFPVDPEANKAEFDAVRAVFVSDPACSYVHYSWDHGYVSWEECAPPRSRASPPRCSGLPPAVALLPAHLTWLRGRLKRSCFKTGVKRIVSIQRYERDWPERNTLVACQRLEARRAAQRARSACPYARAGGGLSAARRALLATAWQLRAWRSPGACTRAGCSTRRAPGSRS